MLGFLKISWIWSENIYGIPLDVVNYKYIENTYLISCALLWLINLHIYILCFYKYYKNSRRISLNYILI